MNLEREVEQRLVTLVEQAGGLCVKHGQDGWPDRIVMLPHGVLVWVEVKRPKGIQAGLQKYRASQLHTLGQNIVVLSSIAEVNEFMSELTDVG